jgi:O-antigen ligase
MRFVGLLFVLVSLPVFIALLRTNKDAHRYAYLAIGMLPFTQSFLNLDASIINLAGGLGYVQGLVVSLLDALALAVLATARNPFANLPFRVIFALYAFAAFISMFQAVGKWYPLGYTFQIMRMFITFAAVAVIVQRPNGLRLIAYGLAIAAMVQGGVCIYQRATGVFQATGTLGHQNLLGMMLHFTTLPLLAMLLAGDRSKLLMWGVAGGLAAVALGASRGTYLFLAVGVVLLCLFTLARGITTRKLQVLGVAALMGLVAAPFIYNNIQQRYSTMQVTEYDERAAFEAAASAIFEDHPMGVGAGRYVFTANVGGYSARAGVTWAGNSRNATVHHLYLLTAAELGWIGLIAIIMFLLAVIWKGFRFALGNKRDPRGDIVLGCTVAVLATALHSLYEWVFVLSSTQYMIAISMGIIAGCLRARAAEQRLVRAGSPGRGDREPAPVLVRADT